MGWGRVTLWTVANNASHTAIPLIMTRPLPASEAFLRTLPPDLLDRLNPVFSPLIEIVPLHPTDPMADADAAVFSSANGVAAAPAGHGRTAYCVGPATTAAAQAHGWDARQCGATANDLVETLTRTAPTQRLVHLSGRHTRGDVAARLTAAGLKVQHIALYDQRQCALSDQAKDSILRENRVIVPLFSPRTATQFATEVPRRASVHVIALSAAVADALGARPWGGVTIADSPDARAMGAALAARV